MEANKGKGTHGGGRPQKDIKRDQHLAVKCSRLERKLIEHKAKAGQLTVSEYLRGLGLNGQVDIKQKALPKEVLLLTGMLNHTASNLNQIAHRRNRGDELNAGERTELMRTAAAAKEAACAILNYLK